MSIPETSGDRAVFSTHALRLAGAIRHLPVRTVAAHPGGMGYDPAST